MKIGNTQVSELLLETGVRQGCPAIPILSNISLSNLKEEMSIAQEGEVVVGNRKIFSISYADDIDILATSSEGLKEIIKRLYRYLKRKGLELNTGKTKIMIFKKT